MTSALPAALVVVDTDVFSKVFVSTSGPDRRDLIDRLVGRLSVIATQTKADYWHGHDSATGVRLVPRSLRRSSMQRRSYRSPRT